MALTGTHSPGDTQHVTDHNLIDAFILGSTSTGRAVLAATDATAARTAIGAAAAGAGGMPATVVNTTTARTAAVGEFVQGDTTGGGFTVTLPSSPAVGALVAVKRVAGAGTLTVAPAGAGTVDGDATATIVTTMAGGLFEHVGSDVWRVLAVMAASGPQGPAGPAGGTGPTGNQGPQGVGAGLDVAAPTGVLAETYPRRFGGINAAGWVVSGRMVMAAVYLPVGTVVTSVAIISGTTAMTTGTNQWVALYSPSRARLAVSGNDTTTAWPANTAKTFTLTSPYTVLSTGLYYVGLVVTATTPPSVFTLGSGSSVMSGLAPAVCGTADTGLTDPSSAPATTATITALPGLFYAQVR